ncbi:MAG: lamin tail domain-containing protein, partial [Tepidisphaeraceae bacterium]
MLESRQLLSALPLISEFMASNKTTLADAQGDYSDWLEIYNPDSQQALDLTGWQLQRGNNTWAFPSMTLGPGEFRIIFADSQAGYNDPNGELHATFNLSKDGSSLRLIDNTGQTVSDYYSPYPAQQQDVSYGIGQQITETKLVSAGDSVRYYIPTSGSLGQSWTAPGFVDSSWALGTTGLGFAQAVPGFSVWNYKSGNTGTIGSLATAQSIIDNPANQSWVQSETAPTINYLTTGGAGHFVYDRAFPGLDLGVQQNNWVTQATGKIHIAAAGTYTFGVNSDDGFRLQISGATRVVSGITSSSGTATVTLPGHGFATGDTIHISGATQSQYNGDFVITKTGNDTFTYTVTGSPTSPALGTITASRSADGGVSRMEYDGTRGSADTLGAFTFSAAGDYSVNLMYFQGGGTAELEMFAAPGNLTSWGATTTWRLVGDTANGGLGVTSYPFTGSANSVAGKVKTDIRSAMQSAIALVQQQSGNPAADTSLYARMTFDAPNLASLTTLTLKMAYDDGYVVYLNGVQVASKNAPTTVAWNSQALAERTSEVQSSTFENFDITAYLNPATPGHLQTTGNVLAIQLLNASATDGDMLLLPEISQIVSTQSAKHFFSTATPAAANSQEFWEKLPDPLFSADHAMYTQSFPLTLSTATQSVTKLTRKSSTATATVPNHGFVAGDVVRISGATPAQYDGDFTITNVTQNTFDYTVSGSPVTPATGKITAQRLDKLYYTVDSSDPWTDPIVRTASAVTRSGSTATFTSNNHGFSNGNMVLISGAVQPEYNGLFSISGVTANTFTYTVPGAPATTATGTIVAQHVDLVVTSLTASGTTVTATVANHGLANGDLVRIVGASPAEYNGDFIVANVTANTFTYTLGAAPSASSATGGMAAFKLGTQYTGPITISTTTTVRAVAYNGNGYMPSNVVTQTYVFPNDVIQQPVNPPGFPGSWDTWPADYQMDPRVTTDPAYRNTLVEALESIPSMSIVSDKTNLFDPANGIYANQAISLNSNYNGTPMRVPGSLEYFAADGSNDFQINAGVSIYGGVGRSPQYKKHSFRIVFNSDYGGGKLVFPLFGDGGATSFNTLILRSQFNDAWTWTGSLAQFIRDAFAPDLQIAMGDPSHHSQFVNLYVDGLYWGVYQATERPDADFSASYMGGSADDWESNNAGYSNGVTNNLPAWNDLMAKTTFGITSTA